MDTNELKNRLPNDKNIILVFDPQKGESVEMTKDELDSKIKSMIVNNIPVSEPF